MSENRYDLMILGSGPAGMTAALFGQRLGLKVIVFGDIPGGSTYMIHHLANFPGFMEETSGTQFGTMTFQQAQSEVLRRSERNRSQPDTPQQLRSGRPQRAASSPSCNDNRHSIVARSGAKRQASRIKRFRQRRLAYRQSDNHLKKAPGEELTGS